MFALKLDVMINLQDYPRVWPELLPALEVALVKHAEAQAKMADFKKKYTSVKAKVKRLEKDMAAMDEAKEGHYIRNMGYDVQLAVNKFILIDKKLKRYANESERNSKNSIKALRSSKTFEPQQTRWHIGHIEGLHHQTDWLLREVADMLRIAKGHLGKVDAAKKTMAKHKKNQIYLNALSKQIIEKKRLEAEAMAAAAAAQATSTPPAENQEGEKKQSWWARLTGR
jgi:hypothetical protein